MLRSAVAQAVCCVCHNQCAAACLCNLCVLHVGFCLLLCCNLFVCHVVSCFCIVLNLCADALCHSVGEALKKRTAASSSACATVLMPEHGV